MKRLLITKASVAYSATTAAGTANSLTTKDQLDVLKEGSIVAFQKDGTRVTAAGSFSKTEQEGFFVIGLPSGHDIRRSPMINFATLEYNKQVYVAATKQVTIMGDDGVADKTSGAFAAGDVGTEFTCTVVSTSGDFRAGTTALLRVVSTGVDLAANTELVLGAKYLVIAAGTPDAWGGATLASSLAGTLVVGTKAVGAEYGIDVIDLQKETWEKRVYNISTALADASRTTANMLADIVALANAHPQVKNLVLAAVTTGNVGLSFTSVNEGERFQIIPKGLFYGTTVNSDGSGASIVAVTGVGTNAQILNLEASCAGVDGKTGTYTKKQGAEIYTVPSLVETGVNYTQYVLTWDNPRKVAYPSVNSSPTQQTLTIAVPSTDSTMITAIDNILDDLIA